MVKVEAPSLSREEIQKYQTAVPENPRKAAKTARQDVLQALTPAPFTRERVLLALRSAQTPNEVSQAVRDKLSPLP